MSLFMLLLADDPTEYTDLSPAELQEIIARYSAWSQQMAASGRLQGGHKLTDEGGRVLRREGDAVVVRDGPYAELREIVSGYFLIEASDYADAEAVARSCPHAQSRGSITIRAIEFTGDS
ncbi:MAG TPA: YciI family protein [Gemmatimonas sp.]|uniref:YciI family protein n=1 Tax=Gemmatimonas sp. TaxID=1962908 RepID=UPI002EDA20CE